MKRLFYFTGYRLNVMHWKGKEMVGSNSFEPTQAGLQEFRAYLLHTEKIISRFLIDVIEEDFRNEIIPHVGSKDRISVITRLVDRYYRSSRDYCYSEVLGREKNGRKDDIVLLGALTNPQLIRPWLEILDDCEIPLSGIWTQPLISKKLLKTIKATSGVVLLVSQQVNSNIRQTLFRDGKLISSRQSIINQDIGDISGIGGFASPEVDRTIDFLRAQGLISTNEVINLHILGSERQIESLQKSFKSSDHQTVTIHPLAEVKNKLGLSGIEEKFADGIFAWLCLNQVMAKSHYGPQKSFKRYRNSLAVTALYLSSLLVVIAGVLQTESNISNTLEYEKSITLLKQQGDNYKDLYERNFKQFEEVFQKADLMNSAVSLADRIKQNGQSSPLDFMITLSKILSQPGVGTVNIDKVEWRAINIDEKNKEEVLANFTDKQTVMHAAVITGRIVESDNNYRESVDRVQSIIDYLRANPRIENVETLKMPVDMRSESQFSAEEGVYALKKRKMETSGVFSLKVIMKAPDHA